MLKTDILVNMLKKEKKRVAETEAELDNFGRNIPRSSSMTDGDMTNGDIQRNKTFSRTPSNNSLSHRDRDDQKRAKICKYIGLVS